MPVVWIPALLRDLTGGTTQVDLPGETVSAVLEALEQRFPGVKARLLENEQLRPNLTLLVDGLVSPKRLRTRVAAGSEIHFLPTISGGA